MKRKPIIIGIAAIALAAGIVALAHRKGGAADEDDGDSASISTIVPVETATLRLATVHGYVEAYGGVVPAPAEGDRPPASAKVQSQTAGLVARTLVTEGEAVEMGAPLFDLDSRSALIAVSRAAKAAQFARDNADRQRRLFADQNTSTKALQDAEGLAAGAEADLAAAQTQLAWLHIAAPLSGVVTHINVRPGETVDAATILAEVTDLGRLVVESKIPSGDAVRVKAGQPVRIMSDPAVEASLTFVSPTVDPGTDTVTLRAALPRDCGLRLGQFVPLRITTAEHANVLVAPAESVVANADGASVVAVVTGDEAVQHPVTVGIKDGNLAEVAGRDLKPGDTVVTVGAYGLPEKTKVRTGEGTPAAQDPKQP